MKLFEIPDAAQALNIKPDDLWAVIKSGQVKAVEVEGKFYVSDSELATYFTASPAISDSPHRPSGPSARRRRHHIFHGITSRSLEAISEITHEFRLVSELSNVIAQTCPEFSGMATKLNEEGVTDVNVAMDLLLIDEARQQLRTRRSLLLNLTQGTCILILPLPPHLGETFLAAAPASRVFMADKTPPPWLRDYQHISNLSSMALSSVLPTLKGVTAAILEGHINRDGVLIRDEAATLVFWLVSTGLTEVYLHNIPLLPAASKFVPLDLSATNVTLRAI